MYRRLSSIARSTYGATQWENKLAFFAPKHITIPVAVSVFPDEIYTAPKSWTEQAFPHLIYYNRLNKGGHFAAWEQPELFVQEMRAAFKSVRLIIVFAGVLQGSSVFISSK